MCFLTLVWRWRVPTVGVFAAIFDPAGRLLVVRHAYGACEWGLPGGRLEAGEDPISAVVREVFEETGVSAEIRALVGLYSAPDRDDLVLLFEGRAKLIGPWWPDTEIAEQAFVQIDALPEPMGANPLSRIQDVIAGRRGVVRTFLAPGEVDPTRSLDA